MPTVRATQMIRYFQTGYRFMVRAISRRRARWAGGPVLARSRTCVAVGSARSRRRAGNAAQCLDRALRQELGYRSPLDGDLGSGGDLDRDLLVADLRDASEDPAGGD